MSWAEHHIERLSRGETVQFRPRGGSMSGRIEDGQLVTVKPVASVCDVDVGDAVLVTMGAWTYVHLVKAKDGSRVLIGNNRGRINGWTDFENVHGKVTEVTP